MFKHHQKAIDSLNPQTLYIVATPIGNLADITLRALAVLQKADLICAEDTRVSAQLLSAYGIRSKLLSVREHNEQQMSDKVVAALAEGKMVAQISDAGTPAVCDPGAKLVNRVREAGYAIVPVVGASALMATLSVAGVLEPHFYFHGFLPAKSTERQKLFQDWQNSPHAIIAFESPHRIVACLNDMAAVSPKRHLLLARELTKTFESLLHGTAHEIQQQLSSQTTRGEMVLVLYPQAQTRPTALNEESQRIMAVLSAELPTKQAADLTAKITGENKKALYDWAIIQKNQGDISK